MSRRWRATNSARRRQRGGASVRSPATCSITPPILAPSGRAICSKHPRGRSGEAARTPEVGTRTFAGLAGESLAFPALERTLRDENDPRARSHENRAQECCELEARPKIGANARSRGIALFWHWRAISITRAPRALARVTRPPSRCPATSSRPCISASDIAEVRVAKKLAWRMRGRRARRIIFGAEQGKNTLR